MADISIEDRSRCIDDYRKNASSTEEADACRSALDILLEHRDALSADPGLSDCCSSTTYLTCAQTALEDSQ